MSSSQSLHISFPEPPMFLMCDPSTNFKVVEGNDFSEAGKQIYAEDPEGIRTLATRQWQALKAALESVGAEVVEVAADPDLPDQVFQADPSQTYVKVHLTDEGQMKYTASVVDRVTMMSNFAHSGRVEEPKHQRSRIEQIIADRRAGAAPDVAHNIYQSRSKLEGTGDNVYDPFRDVIWAGHGQRSDILAHAELKKHTGVDVVSVKLKAPFFHMDTCLAPLPGGHMLVCKEGMTDEAFKRVKHRAFTQFGLPEEEFLIEVSREDAMKFACNVVCVGNHIFMPGAPGDEATSIRAYFEERGMTDAQITEKFDQMGIAGGNMAPSKALVERLEALGYEVHPIEMSALMLAGGAAHCCVNRVNQPRIEGGTMGLYTAMVEQKRQARQNTAQGPPGRG